MLTTSKEKKNFALILQDLLKTVQAEWGQIETDL